MSYNALVRWSIFISLCCFLATFTLGAISTQERAALIDFYNATNGDYWTINSGWKTPPLDTDGFAMPGTENSWYGVAVQNDHVTILNYIRNNLNGSIPNSIGNLPYLVELNLHYNQINGSIPTEIGNLTHLTNLYLEANQISGSIPSNMGNCSNLKKLHLGRNQLSGFIPSELGYCTNLQYIWFETNQLSGLIPLSFQNIYNLKGFSLHHNMLSGLFPNFLKNYPNLETIELSYNQFSGPIPEEIGNLSHLRNLMLSYNNFQGEIPTSLTNLTTITRFDIGYNCVYTNDPELVTWLDTYDPGWDLHQDQCEETSTITITSPNGREEWTVGSLHEITWKTTGTIEKVSVHYSINDGSTWKTIIASTENTGSYSWLVPNTPSTQCRVKISDTGDDSIGDISDLVFTITAPTPPHIYLNRNQLNFGAIYLHTDDTTNNSQNFLINNTGGGTLNWTTEFNASWITCSPSSGTGNHTVSVTVNTIGLVPRIYNDTITINSPNADNSPKTIDVYFTVKFPSTDNPPFGEFATPLNGSKVSSSVPVTGWVLDDIEVKNVKIYRKSDQSLVFIGDAVFVEGARPDVESGFPDYPFNYKAGWGYMLLTYFLPNQGNGVFELHAIATDVTGQETTLGIKTITVNNSNAVKPFGAIDTPPQGGNASGKNYVNWGWALTPQPNYIPTDGFTIDVWVDSIKVGNPVYNIFREDIATLFPLYANSTGAAGYFYLDTTTYENGIHTISWNVTDSEGNTDGIGSRYFSVINTSTDMAMSNLAGIEENVALIPPGRLPVSIKPNMNSNSAPIDIYPDNQGNLSIESHEMEKIEIILTRSSVVYVVGYQLVGNSLRPLPTGSTLDSGKGIFYWQPPLGFLGQYRLIFIELDNSGAMNRKNIAITVNPKFSNRD